MNILGISGAIRAGNHDGAAVLIKDGKIEFASEEERYLKIKHAPGFLPEYAIRRCLKESKLGIKDIDLVVFPGKSYQNIKFILKKYFYYKFGYAPKIKLIDHHFAHASSSYFMSGFKESFVITADLSGDSRSTVIFYAKDCCLKEIKFFPKPNSLGIFYALITQFLGFKYNNDEYKAMALAGYGKPSLDLSWLLDFKRGDYRLNLRYVDARFRSQRSNPSEQEPIFKDVFLKKVGFSPKSCFDSFSKKHKNLAASAQKVLENVYLSLIDGLAEDGNKINLCLAGGLSLNTEVNSKIYYSGKVKNLFIQPVASDAGLALGGAIYYSLKHGDFKPHRLRNVYLGSRYGNGYIKKTLDNLGIKYKFIENIENVIASALSKGKIVALFRGRMEYGPRSLGNRSILADPRNRNSRDKLNKVIKTREDFQPFAPAVIEECFEDFFIASPKCNANLEFMVLNVKVKPGIEKNIPAVVHVNGTSRVQIVRKSINIRFYSILEEFSRRTGIPVLLNTSLNTKGVPIAENPQQALAVFYSTAIDSMAIGDFWIEKYGT